eukprot:14455963-Alexandrium_andersonii.AAC.1
MHACPPSSERHARPLDRHVAWLQPGCPQGLGAKLERRPWIVVASEMDLPQGTKCTSQGRVV